MASSSKPRAGVWISIFLAGLLALGGGGYYFADLFFGARDSLDEAEVLTDVFPKKTAGHNLVKLGQPQYFSWGQTVGEALGRLWPVLRGIAVT